MCQSRSPSLANPANDQRLTTNDKLIQYKARAENLPSSAKLNNPVPVPLRRPTRRQYLELPRRPAFRRRFLPRFAAGFSFPIKVCATDAGPRTSLNPSTSTSNSPPSFVIRSVSPTRTSRAAFATWPFDTIRPRSQAFFASVRVLKKRVAQSHASIRRPVIVQF